MRIPALAFALASMLSACAAPAPVASPINDGGLVIGTLSYPLQAEPRHALVKFSRIAPRNALTQTYLLDAAYDAGSAQAIFSGSLPSGMYVVEEALSDDARYVPGALKMPFEIQPGQVTDAGNFLMEPRAALLRTTLAQ
ncbi:MAG TPA: hypothetical protein VHE37_16750 [Nevskiaceae bacterium]|nr:hypothetical protein [Nevskiaceae bacterium]